MASKKINKKKSVVKKSSVKSAKVKAKSKPAIKASAKTAKKPLKKVKAKIVVKKSTLKTASKKIEKKVVAKAAAPKVVAPSKAIAPKAVVKEVEKPVSKIFIAPAFESARITVMKEYAKPQTRPGTFDKGVKVVYPAHGVGEIIGVETHLVAGTELKQYVIQFEREKMVLRVPVARAERSGLRMLSSDGELKDMKKTLLERPKSSRGMWSRRAKEYESKINSGNIIAVAEVVRDLHKNVDDPERSYSERVIYENALERLAREVSAIKSLDIPAASDYLIKTINDNNPYFLKKAAAKKAAAEAEGDDESLAA